VPAAALLASRCTTGQCGEGRRNPLWSDGSVAAGVAPGSINHGILSGRTMTGDQDRLPGKTGAGVKDSRRDRLKLALRENLKRRKSQARGRSDATPSESADASLDDASGEKS